MQHYFAGARRGVFRIEPFDFLGQIVLFSDWASEANLPQPMTHSAKANKGA
jgi:hypothetical protein